MGRKNEGRYELIDGVEQNRAHPETFEIPSDEEQQALKPGDSVKVGFLLGPTYPFSAERIWLTVVAINGDAIYCEIANDPVLIKMEVGDPVTIARKNILDMETLESVQEARAQSEGFLTFMQKVLA